MATELEAQLMKARTDLGAAQDNIAALEQVCDNRGEGRLPNQRGQHLRGGVWIVLVGGRVQGLVFTCMSRCISETSSSQTFRLVLNTRKLTQRLQELRCLKCALQSEQEATNATAAEVVTTGLVIDVSTMICDGAKRQPV
eukprot:scaffold87756_cov17-Tisochrysis_lutea.AAC.1